MAQRFQEKNVINLSFIGHRVIYRAHREEGVRSRRREERVGTRSRESEEGVGGGRRYVEEGEKGRRK